MEVIAKYIHGSENSLDKDIMYAVDELPSLAECKEFCSDKEENRNLIVIKGGVVTDCYKGTPDECNNSLFHTYSMHKQDSPLLVTRTVERDIPIKAIRAVRGIISHLSRTSYRPQIKEALRSEIWLDRIKALRDIDLSTIDWDNCQNNMSGADVKKLIAFQCAQFIALRFGIELYTKNEVCDYFRIMAQYMKREDTDVSSLQFMVNTFCYMCSITDVSMYDLKTEKKKENV